MKGCRRRTRGAPARTTRMGTRRSTSVGAISGGRSGRLATASPDLRSGKADVRFLVEGLAGQRAVAEMSHPRAPVASREAPVRPRAVTVASLVTSSDSASTFPRRRAETPLRRIAARSGRGGFSATIPVPVSGFGGRKFSSGRRPRRRGAVAPEGARSASQR
jgi:hypothetical protein